MSEPKLTSLVDPVWQAMSTETQPEPTPSEPVEQSEGAKVEEKKQTKTPAFSFRIEQAELLSVLNLIATISDEATWNIDSDGIRTRTMDPSRVAMINAVLGKDMFEEYDYTKEAQPLKFAFNVTEFLKILRRFRKDDKVTVESQPDTARFKISAGERTFSLPMLEPSEEEVPEPKVTFTTTVNLVTDQLKKAVEDCALATDHVKITTTPESIVFESVGDFLTARNEFKKGGDALFDLEGAEAKAIFSLKYLTDIVKNISSDMTRFSYTTDMPFKIEIEAKAKLTVYMAPRIEVE